jgi:hypothetical protein
MNGTFSENSLQQYSNLVKEKVELNYSEEAGSYDFTLCVRPDGSLYGTGGQCRKGTETSSRVPIHQHKSLKEGGSSFTPLEKALSKLKNLERRIKDPDYSPSDEELARYGRLKGAVEEAQRSSEKKDREINLPRKAPMDLKAKVDEVVNKKSTPKRDFKDALESMKDEIDKREKEVNGNFGLNKMFPGPWQTAQSKVLESMKENYDKAVKIYNNRYV